MAPELEAFAKQLVESVREVSRQENARMVGDLSARLEDKIAGLRLELRAEFLEIKESQSAQRADLAAIRVEQRRQGEDLAAIKTVQGQQGTVLGQHTAQIAEINARLENGDRKFDDFSGRQDRLEKTGRSNEVSLVALAGAVSRDVVKIGLGAGTTVAILKMLGV